MAPDLGRREDAIAEAVVEMVVGVDDPQGSVGDPPDLVHQFAALSLGAARVHDQRIALPDDQADRDVEVRVAADEDAVGNLAPHPAGTNRGRLVAPAHRRTAGGRRHAPGFIASS